VLIFPAPLVIAAFSLFGSAASTPPMGEMFRWALSVWVLGVFHALLFMQESRPPRKAARD